MDRRIQEAIEFLHGNFDQPTDVAALARRVGLSYSRFIHLFKAETGIAPARYLKEMRLARAAFLLTRTPWTVKEICFAVGFSGENRFVHSFKEAYGVAPSQYRRQEI